MSRQQEEKLFISHKGMNKEFGTEECSSQNLARCRASMAEYLCVNRHHPEVPAPTNCTLDSLTFSSDLKVRERVHEQQK